MLPSSIRTFMSLIQAPSTPRSVEVARLTPCLIASSKLVSETALSSVTLATDIDSPLPWPVYCLFEHLLPAPAENKRFATKTRRLGTSVGTVPYSTLLIGRTTKAVHIACRRKSSNLRPEMLILEFGQQNGIASRLIRAPGRLDGHRYHVGLCYGVRDRRRRHVPVGLEESAGFGHVALYDPDLARLVLRYRRHIPGHKDDLVLFH